jgi:PAS domain S-box-containing protein
MLGYAPDELPHTYETWASLLHPDEAAAVQRAMQRHIRAGEDFGIDFRMRTRDEGWRWIHAIGKSVEKAPDGTTLRLIGTHTDITDRVEAQLERERMYERRAEQVRAASAIAQELAAVPALDELFRRVVTLIKERFGYYHVQIFRHQPALDRVVLVAGYGEIGARMMADGHSLPMGHGVVGTAAAARRAVLASDVRQSAEWTPNRHLPETRGELAVPIVLRNQLLGIVDVQSDTAGSLGEDDQLLLESICGPIAVAVEDTNLRQEMEARLRELNTLQRIMTRQEWDAFRSQEDLVDGFVFDQQSVVPTALSASSPASTSHQAVSVPMDVSGEVIGILGVYEDPDHPLLGEDRNVLRDISGQVTEALQRAQLLEQAQSRASRERLIRDIADKIQRATDLSSLMRITSEELLRALRGTRAYVRLGTEEELTQDAGTDGRGIGGRASGAG